MSNDNFYREEMMEHYKHPQNKGTLPDPTVTVHEDNPMCGDDLTLMLKVTAINGSETITEIAYDGNACAVSIVSASMLSERVKGLTLAEAKALTKEDLLKMVDFDLTTSRIKCATLSLEALGKAITKYEQSKN